MAMGNVKSHQKLSANCWHVCFICQICIRIYKHNLQSSLPTLTWLNRAFDRLKSLPGAPAWRVLRLSLHQAFLGGWTNVLSGVSSTQIKATQVKPVPMERFPPTPTGVLVLFSPPERARHKAMRAAPSPQLPRPNIDEGGRYAYVRPPGRAPLLYVDHFSFAFCAFGSFFVSTLRPGHPPRWRHSRRH